MVSNCFAASLVLHGRIMKIWLKKMKHRKFEIAFWCKKDLRFSISKDVQTIGRIYNPKQNYTKNKNKKTKNKIHAKHIQQPMY